ncbi:efflux RND transporter permease subunit [Pseudohongiella sp.]|uniref:SSD domain-containing protein n=1 Tax=marine sediment metagenome TaxID=412755 RepID=A0A0F9YH12_9ZZZZ|nr:efflux RND transporter permease subunit [Pseudohongiella sp.]HDZ09219.1 efflux RND transporter permease subunit [Pseudohongiella sp.]HEA63353.1 efflux RND transporter permease subunit [Pseudohongiella sp.]
MFVSVVNRAILVTVITLIITVIGVVAATRIPVQMIPDVELRTISVETRWPGATPQDIEKDILIEQERFLRNVPNLSRLVASAGSGSAQIELEFPFGTDVVESMIQVNNALSQVSSYPRNVDQPRIVAASFSSNAFMYFRVGTLPGNPADIDIERMQDFIEDRVRPLMESVAGVSEVSVGGGTDRQIQVDVDGSALAQRGLSVLDVRDAILARNQDISGGELTAGKRRYLLRTVGRFESRDELGDVVLLRQGDAVVRLADVASISQGQARRREISTYDGEPVLGMQVRRQSGSNVLAIKRAMMDEVELINRDVLAPAGLILQLSTDDTRYVEASIGNVWTNLGIGAIFATLVMFLFLRSVNATFVGVIGIPLCAVAAFLGLMLTGRTINVISLAGIAFAIGMTIDNSIVVLENIERFRRKGLDRFASAIEGVREVWPAVLASTMTTVLVFLPILFIEEEAGQLYSDVAIAISSAILVSMAVAIFVIPTLSARLDFSPTSFRRRQQTGATDRSAPGATLSFASNAIRGLIERPVRRLLVIGSTVFACGFIILVLTPPAEYLPEGEEAKTFASMSAPPGYNLAAMAEIGEQVRQHMLPHVNADPGAFERGETEIPPITSLNLSITATGIRIIAETVNPRHIEALMTALTDYYETFPGMRAFAAKGSIISSNDGGTRSINMDISGPDLVSVYTAANLAYDRAREVFDNPRIQSQPSALNLAQPLVQIRPDWQRVAELGLSGDAIGFTVAALTEGAYVDDFFLDDDKVDLYLYGDRGADQAAMLADLPGLLLRTGDGRSLPLSSLATIEETVDTSTVRRVNGRRTVTLNIIPPDDIALETGVEMVRTELIQALQNEGHWPTGVDVSLSGASDQLNATRDALMGNFLIAVLIVYLLLVAIFSHWGYPLLIMTTIPLGVAGGIVGLALMNLVGGLLPLMGLQPISQPFDMITMLGFLILMGTVVNNPILVVDQARRNLAEKHVAVVDAVAAAVDSRLRPIAMTTLTTLCGLAPLVLLPGEGTELYRGVGAIVLFGLVGAAIVTVTFLPALLVLILARFGPGHQVSEAPAPSVASAS